MAVQVLEQYCSAKSSNDKVTYNIRSRL